MQSVFTIDNFDCKFTKTDEGLLIEAKDQSSETFFSKSINSETAKSLSKEHVFDVDTIYELLKQASGGKKSDGVSLTLTKEGVLTYSCKLILGTLVRESGFTIHLEEQSKDPLPKLVRLVDSLSAQSAELRETVKGIDNSIKAQDDRFDKFEKLIVAKLEKIEASFANIEKRLDSFEMSSKSQMNSPEDSIVHEDCSFNPNGAFASGYELSNQNKTAKTNKMSGPYVINSIKPIPSSLKCKFAFRIEGDVYVMVGIAPERAFNSEFVYEDKETFGYGKDGNLYRGSANGRPIGPKYGAGNRVTFIVEPGKIFVRLNDKHVHEEVISQGLNYYPFLYTNNSLVNGGATFISDSL